MIEATAPREAGVLAPAPEPAAAPASSADKEVKPFGPDGFTFADLIDIINPLQHIPLISTIYRKLTGDEISPVARIAGATLFGGPIGAAFAMVDSAVEHKTGRDIGANALAALFPDKEAPTGGGTEFARATSAAPAGKAVQGFAPRVADPIQLVPAGAAAKPFVAPAAPDLQALGGPIRLEPRHAIAPWSAPEQDSAAVPQAAPESEPEIAKAALPRTWIRPAQDLPKGSSASLARQAMRAYAASTTAHASSSTPPAKAIEIDTAAARNDWILEAMLRAHEKYADGHRLQSNPGLPTQAVTR